MIKTGMDAVRNVISLAELARHLNITRGGVAQWDKIPAERIKEVSEATGLSYETLRPDLFPEPASRSEVA